MKCKFDKTLLSFYLDNELSDEEARRVELHLKKCESCRKKLSELKEVSIFLDKIQDVELSSDYDKKFKEKFDKAVKKKKQAEPDITPWEKKKLGDEVKEILSGTSNKTKVAVATALVVIMSFSLFALRPGSYPTIITAKGQIQKYNDELQSWKKISSGDVIEKGDVIKTAKNSFIDIELDGIYKMRIKPDSQVSVNEIIKSRKKGNTQFQLSKGNVLVKIEKELKKSRFQIKTASGIAEAKGTAFIVDADSVNKETLLGVSEGSVLVKTSKKECLVGKDEKVIVSASGVTRGPYPLEEKDEKDLAEIKEIGKIFVVLGISDTAQRTRELLEPARFYAYGKYPLGVGELIDKALVYLSYASQTDKRKMHLASIKELNNIIEEYPAKRYNPQILLFVGAYYEYLSLHQKALSKFQQVIDRYADTEWASIAVLAQAIIYKEKMGEFQKAEKLYDRILKNYPETPEAVFVQNKLVSSISNK